MTNIIINTTGETNVFIDGTDFVIGTKRTNLEQYPYSKQQNYTNPCENCSNNPLNNPFATGFCNCVLPYMNNIIY